LLVSDVTAEGSSVDIVTRLWGMTEGSGYKSPRG